VILKIIFSRTIMCVFVLPRTHIHICPRGPNFIMARDMMCREALNLLSVLPRWKC
jgi:hypothetical protein